MLVRWFQGRAVFTEPDWLLLFGRHREKVFTLRLWLRFAALLFAVMAIEFALGRYVLPYGLGWFVGALILAAMGVFAHRAEEAAYGSNGPFCLGIMSCVLPEL